MVPMARTVVLPHLHRPRLQMDRRVRTRLSQPGRQTAPSLRHRIRDLLRMIPTLTRLDPEAVEGQLPFTFLPIRMAIVAHRRPAPRDHSAVFRSLVLLSGASLFGDTDLTIRRWILGGLILAMVRA